MRIRAITRSIVLTSALLGGCVACADSAPNPPRDARSASAVSTSGPISAAFPVTAQQVRKLIVRYAAECGDDSPTGVTYVLTNRKDAERIVYAADTHGGGMFDSDPVVVAEANGRFSDGSAPRPPGAAAPSGSAVTITVDTKGEITDRSVGDHHVDLHRLGEPVPLGS